MEVAIRSGRLWVSPPARIVTIPTGATSSISRLVPGVIPAAARESSPSPSRSRTRLDDHRLARLVVREAARLDRSMGARSAPGIGSPWGSTSGSSSVAAIRRSNFSEMWCSSRSASSWMSAQS